MTVELWDSSDIGDSSDEGDGNYEDLLFPPLEIYEYSLGYLTLSSALQNYFSEVFGEEPFDLSATLDALELVE